QPPRANRPVPRTTGTREAVRRAVRQGVYRGPDAAGRREGRQGSGGGVRASRGEVRRRETSRRRHCCGASQGGTVRDPPPERRQGRTGHRGRGPGRPAVQAERLPREGGAARFLELRLTDLTAPVATRAVARDEPERQAIRTDRRPCRRQHREATERDYGQGEVALAVVRGPG